MDIDLLTGLSGLLEARDGYTHGHGQRVARYAGRVARAMHLPPAEVAKIRAAAAVHDVGKLHTPREILNNPGRLTDAEFAVIKCHPADGADMLAAAGDPAIAAMVRHHHERLDGRGYPDGLAGSEIPLGARIIAVADTFDAITSSRAYRPAGTQKKALDILSKEAGSQLDAAAVAAFLGCYSSRRSVAWCALTTAIPQRILEGLQVIPSAVGINPGLATILPAIGAAGLLAFPHGVHANALADRYQATSHAVALRAKLTTMPALTTGADAHGAGHVHIAQRSPRHSGQSGSGQPYLRAVPLPPISAARHSPGNGIPSSTAGASAGPSEPAVVTAAPVPKVTSSLPNQPEPVLPVGSVPKLPVPSNPAVPSSPTVPSSPAVPSNLPVTIPSVTTPAVTLPGVATVPNVTVSNAILPQTVGQTAGIAGLG